MRLFRYPKSALLLSFVVLLPGLRGQIAWEGGTSDLSWSNGDNWSDPLPDPYTGRVDISMVGSALTIDPQTTMFLESDWTIRSMRVIEMQSNQLHIFDLGTHTLDFSGGGDWHVGGGWVDFDDDPYGFLALTGGAGSAVTGSLNEIGVGRARAASGAPLYVGLLDLSGVETVDLEVTGFLRVGFQSNNGSGTVIFGDNASLSVENLEMRTLANTDATVIFGENGSFSVGTESARGSVLLMGARSTSASLSPTDASDFSMGDGSSFTAWATTFDASYAINASVQSVISPGTLDLSNLDGVLIDASERLAVGSQSSTEFYVHLGTNATLRVGSESDPGVLSVGQGFRGGKGELVVGSGSVVEMWLSEAIVGQLRRATAGAFEMEGILDLSQAATTVFHADEFRIGAPQDGEPSANSIGVARLANGSGSVGDLVIGSSNAGSQGLLELTNFVMDVASTGSVTVDGDNATNLGALTARVDGLSSGLHLEDGVDFQILNTGEMEVVFAAPPNVEDGSLYTGFRWAGADRTTVLLGWLDTGHLSIDFAALSGFTDPEQLIGYDPETGTYIGFQTIPEPGVAVLLAGLGLLVFLRVRHCKRDRGAARG